MYVFKFFLYSNDNYYLVQMSRHYSAFEGPPNEHDYHQSNQLEKKQRYKGEERAEEGIMF